jgi:hypothetical protein
LPPDDAINTPPPWNLTYYCSYRMRLIAQTLTDAANGDNEDDGIEIQDDLALARALVDAEIGVDAASQATTITQLTVGTATEVE